MDRRVVVLVCDGLGVGPQADAVAFGVAGANTLAHVEAANGGLAIPTLAALGIGRVTALESVPPARHVTGTVARLTCHSAAVDSLAGHGELMGTVTRTAPPTFPDGFPDEVIALVEAALCRPVLGNQVASGTEILARLGPDHLVSGHPIVYTSHGSVLQLAVHESVADFDSVLRWGRRVRAVLDGPYAVGRVIVRQFAGAPGQFRRVARADLPLRLEPAALTALAPLGVTTHGVGKVVDLFGSDAFAEVHGGVNNAAVLGEVRSLLRDARGARLVVATLDDFDADHGHRRDPRGYARCLEEFDADLPSLLELLGPGDLLVVTADHGNDPTAPGFDHTREHVPALLTGRMVPGPRALAGRDLVDVGATVLSWFGAPPGAGTSLLERDGTR